MINEFLAPKLPPNHNFWFQQDGATAHTAVISMAALHLLFQQRVIPPFGDVPWPPRSPDLTAPIFLWGHLKSRACSRHPVDLNALQQAVQDEIINIWKETFREVTRRFSTRVHSGGWRPPKRYCTQKVKQCTTNLNTVVNYNCRSQWPRGLRRRSSAARLLRR
jgi:hypothetical protein